MGDDFQFIDLKVIQGGLLQIDFMNMTEKKGGRMFVSPERFFEKLGRSLQYNHHKEVTAKEEERISKDG